MHDSFNFQDDYNSRGNIYTSQIYVPRGEFTKVSLFANSGGRSITTMIDRSRDRPHARALAVAARMDRVDQLDALAEGLIDSG